MSEEMTPVHPDQPVRFACMPDNPCFNECCRDLNQALTPYDILRMKQNLGISSGEFIRRYTSVHNGPDTGLPVLSFKPDPATGHACPLVTPGGCSVYEDRPGSCRLYPLARAIARSRESGQIQEYYALIEEPHCQGHGLDNTLTVRQWLVGQDVAEHNRQNDKLMGLISLKNRIMPGELDQAQSDIFYLGLYDLDEFRRRILDNELPEKMSLPDRLRSRLETDDLALLDFGHHWVAWMLFGVEMKRDD